MSARPLCIYASELSAASGFNRYNSVDKIALKIWERTDPASFFNAQERNKVQQKQTVQEIIKEYRFEKELETAISSESPIDVNAVVQKVTENSIVSPECIQELQSYVNTSRGTLFETPAINRYETKIKSPIVARNKTFFQCRLEFEDSTYIYIGGRVDGLTADGELVEVKNRQRRLFDTIPEYEKVQLHAYMFLVGLSECHYVQCYGDQDSSEIVEFDTDFWSSIKESLHKFCKQFKVLLEDTETQDRLVNENLFYLTEDVHKSESFL